MHNFIIAAMLVQNFIKIVCCLIAKVLHILSLYKTYGILRQEEEEEKKKNQNKNNSFSASLKRAEKPIKEINETLINITITSETNVVSIY